MGKANWKPGTVLYPVPAVMVSCGTMESPNVITVAWTGTINSDPAMTYVSIRPSRHSFDLIKESGEFVINLVTKDLAYACDYCGVKSGRDLNKFEEMKLTPKKGEQVDAPIIYESPVNIECKVKEIIPLGTHHMFLGEVVSVSVSDEYLDETGKFHFNKTEPICYSHGGYYTLGEQLGTFGYSVKKPVTTSQKTKAYPKKSSIECKKEEAKHSKKIQAKNSRKKQKHQ
ncbi:flavin reductase family protein [Chakrabartyella piscis]|uniref:flavin reductase family protein n=1 Tax=Chakrabartyella piscis TaxID=2918914 RepID=UPI0029589D5C|nr:flavin reductase family protein [Chakrabartyella piscis]